MFRRHFQAPLNSNQSSNLDPKKAGDRFPMTETRDMSGALFKNERKEKDQHPDYRGDITIDGVKYSLAGWVRETRDGKKYLSLSVKPIEDRNEPSRRDEGRNSPLPF
jgi:hypothetical protein